MLLSSLSATDFFRRQTTTMSTHFDCAGGSEALSQKKGTMFCNFCAKANNRKDNFKYTHRVRDPETGDLTCPFLMIHMCKRCYNVGHTANHCTHENDLANLQLYSFIAGGGDSNLAILVREQYERELLRRQSMKCMYEIEKECSFCKNGWKNDTYYKTHNINVCPRLVLTVCPLCKKYGHTSKHCKMLSSMDLSVAGESVLSLCECLSSNGTHTTNSSDTSTINSFLSSRTNSFTFLGVPISLPPLQEAAALNATMI